MCGRFINLSKTSTLKKTFNIKSSLIDDLLSYNISPSQIFYIIFKKDQINIDSAKWGYIFFDKNQQVEKNVFNSRLETIANKNLFRESYIQRKCIIPFNGYYEWAVINNQKTPFFIHIPPSEPMYLAGIWKYLNFKKNDNKAFSIITKKANKYIDKIHDRMPVLLCKEEAEQYLDDKNSLFLNNNFISSIESDLDFYSVSKFVNNPLNNSKECIKPL